MHTGTIGHVFSGPHYRHLLAVCVAENYYWQKNLPTLENIYA